MGSNSTPPTPDSAQDDRLESWKEIAAYLRREVRTVQRWEKRESLPVHRHVHDKLGSVYAFKSELDAWWVSRRAEVENEDAAAADENGAEEIDSAEPELPEVAETPPTPEKPFVVSPKIPLKPKELVRHPVKSLRRPVGVPLGILLVIIAMAAYLIWPRLPFHTNVQGSRVMIAVLPFDNLSGDSEQEYLPDGLTEEMISQLGRLNPDSLGVIARQSSIQQKHSKKTLREIGKDLGVDYIVNGSVRLSKGDPGNPNDDRVRITANLSQVSSNSQIWSQSYDRMLSDVLDVQSEVAQAIAGEIRVKLTPQQRARLAVPRPVNPDAYRAYLKGRYYLNQRALDGLERGIGFFEQAAAIDPNYALASVGIADTYNLLGFYSGLPPKVAYPKAKEAAQKALALDSSLAEAHAALADVRLNYDYDWKGAEAGFRRAIELNPNYAVAHHWYGVMLAISGRSADAGVELKSALLLDPVSLAISCDMALQALYAREFDKSIEQSRKCLELDPAYHMGHAWLGRGYLEKKMYPEAIAEFKKAISLQPANLMALAFLGNAYARSGQPALARKVIRDLQTLSRRHYVAPALIAIVYAGLGENDR
ncbi:MAG: tetratricopeptide repeat protein, partial [Acidobacteria bacterium]|nr:tetratricopeptide repeat protein [Acidobacteriota bacterium]